MSRIGVWRSRTGWSKLMKRGSQGRLTLRASSSRRNHRRWERR